MATAKKSGEFGIQTVPFNPQEYRGITAAGVFVPDGYILLNDLPGAAERTAKRQVMEFAKEQKAIFHLVNGRELARVLLLQLVKKKLDPKRTVAIVPGDGARKIFQYMQDAIRKEPQKYKSLTALFSQPIFISAARKPIQKGEFEIKVGEIDLRRFSMAENILVVDDVISSGQTLVELKKKISAAADRVIDRSREHVRARIPDYSGAIGATSSRWIAAALLTVAPTKKRPLQTGNEFESIITPRVVRHFSGGIPPINSISTFLQKDTKGRAVRSGYRANLSNARLFYRMITKTRKSMELQRRPKK